ncbi:MAG: helix-turn-helix domain-containing protein [Acidobacteriota bacterium]
MTLEEMGALLRQERERQGISLETAATEIKISKKYLVALEEGQTKELPHPVYAKGFVKNYARLLGLDPEEMGTVLSNHYAVDDDQLREPPGQDVRESTSGIRERRPSFAPQGASGFKPSLWLALPLLLVFGGLIWFFFFSSFGQGFSVESVLGLFSSKQEQAAPQSQDAQKPAAPVQQAKPVPATPAPKAETRPEPAAPALADQSGPVQRDLLATTPGPGGVKQVPAAQPSQGASASEHDITPEKLAAEAQFASSGKQVVEINAIQPATVEATAEDGQKRTLTLVKGQRLALRFNDKVVVRFQQAPSVSVKLNGKDYPLEGGKADGKSITFP